MTILKTRREFLYDVGSLGFAIALSSNLVSIIPTLSHDLGILQVDKRHWTEEKINICYLGLGSTGLEIGNNLSGYFGTPLQKVNLRQGSCLPFSFKRNSWQNILKKNLGKQSMAVIVSAIDDPIFFELRKFVIARTPYLWTICMASKTDEKDISDLHYEPNEILRIARGKSFPYPEPENFIQSMLAIYMVQHSYKHDKDFYNICSEAMEELGIE